MGPSVFGGVCFGFQHGLLTRRISTCIHCEKLHLNCAFHCTSALHYTDMGNRGCGWEGGPSPRGSSQPPHRPPAHVVCSAGKSPLLVAQLAGVASNDFIFIESWWLSLSPEYGYATAATMRNCWFLCNWFRNRYIGPVSLIEVTVTMVMENHHFF